MRILLVEDDDILGDGLRDALDMAGETVDWVQDGVSAVHAISSETFDIMVLDLGLPRMDGLTVLRTIRENHHDLPVLILTARDETEDRVSGLDAGADDYLIKPFAFEELQARLRALMRRRSGSASNILQLNDHVVLDTGAREVRVDGTPINLSRREYALLEELARHRNQVLSKDRITELVYGWGEDVESNALEVHIHHLRKKLAYPLIETVRGVGYRFRDASD
ncbi:MAG: DNA-binding response regulator [Gammaproteobacteria bacterium]|nr:MAG: DNA-binding response regulator [Gammaproteobacteria bacterium]